MQSKDHLFYVYHIKTRMTAILNFLTTFCIHTTVMQEFWFSNFEKSHCPILASVIFFTLTGAGKRRELTFSLSIDRPKSICWLSGKMADFKQFREQATIISIIKEKRKRKLSLEPNQHMEILCLPIISNLAVWVPLSIMQCLQIFGGIFNNFDNILLWSPIQAGNCYHSTKY